MGMNKLSEEQIEACKGHTPGEWRIESKIQDGHALIDGENWDELASVVVRVSGIGREEADYPEGQANASLISIAPQLLSEREQLQKELSEAVGLLRYFVENPEQLPGEVVAQNTFASAAAFLSKYQDSLSGNTDNQPVKTEE